MAIEGTLDELRLPDILQTVAQQQKTGILTIQGESTIVAISFLSGRVVAADSLEETVEERLGEVLVREGLLSRQDFARVVEEQRSGKGRLVDLLVDGGYLERTEVLDSLQVQTTELLARVMDWERGEFKFYANDEVAYEEGFRPIAVDELLISLLPEEPDEAVDAEGPLAEVVPLPTAGRRDEGWGTGDALAPGASGESVPSPAGEPDWREVTWTGDETGHGEALRHVRREESRRAEAQRGAVLDGPAATSVADETPGGAVVADGGAVSTPRTSSGAAARWLSAALGLLVVAAVASALLRDASAFLLPLPWQEGERRAYEAVERQALYQVIDSAAKTYYLIENRFPDDLERLVDASLLAPGETTGPDGRRLLFTPAEQSYELRPAGAPNGSEAVSLEATTGDFLLDPEFLTAPQADRSAPLVLLD